VRAQFPVLAVPRCEEELERLAAVVGVEVAAAALDPVARYLRSLARWPGVRRGLEERNPAPPRADAMAQLCQHHPPVRVAAEPAVVEQLDPDVRRADRTPLLRRDEEQEEQEWEEERKKVLLHRSRWVGAEREREREREEEGGGESGREEMSGVEEWQRWWSWARDVECIFFFGFAIRGARLEMPMSDSGVFAMYLYHWATYSTNASRRVRRIAGFTYFSSDADTVCTRESGSTPCSCTRRRVSAHSVARNAVLPHPSNYPPRYVPVSPRAIDGTPAESRRICVGHIPAPSQHGLRTESASSTGNDITRSGARITDSQPAEPTRLFPHAAIPGYSSASKFSAHGASSKRRLTGHGGATKRLTPWSRWIAQTASMSSSSSSTTLAFSSMREGVTDFGIAAIPRETCPRQSLRARLLARRGGGECGPSQLISTFPAATPCLSATFLTAASASSGPPADPSGEYAVTQMPRDRQNETSRSCGSSGCNSTWFTAGTVAESAIRRSMYGTEQFETPIACPRQRALRQDGGGGDAPWSSPWRRASPSPATCRRPSSRAGRRACRRASSGTGRRCRSGSAGSASAAGTGRRSRARAARATRRAPPPRACATCPTASSSRTRPAARSRPQRTRAQTRARPPPRCRTRTRSRRGGSPPPSARGIPPPRLRRPSTAKFLADVSGGHGKWKRNGGVGACQDRSRGSARLC